MKNTLLRTIFFGTFFLSLTALATNYTIRFEAHVATNLPPGEQVCLYLLEREGMGQPPVFPLKSVGDSLWATELVFGDDWLSPGQTYHYRYCRNMESGAADESFGEPNLQGFRELVVRDSVTVVRDTIAHWRWWPDDGTIPPVDTSDYLNTPPDSLAGDSFITAISLPDWWKPLWRDAVEHTLDRLIWETGADWVLYPVLNEVTGLYPTPTIVREGSNGTPEDDLLHLIRSAHRRGLKFCLEPAYYITTEEDLFAPKTTQWWLDYYATYQEIMLYYAQLAQQEGVEMLAFNMWLEEGTIVEEQKSLIDSLALELLAQVRQVYTGKIMVKYDPWGPELEVYRQGDYLGFRIWANWPFTLSESMSPTVSEMETKLRQDMEAYLFPALRPLNKPLFLFQIASYSFDGAVAYIHDGESLNPWNPDDPNYPIDLQEQADVYEAFLRVFTRTPEIAGVGAFTYFYWNSIDKDINIRSKPASRVLRKWCRWVHPDQRYLRLATGPGGTTEPAPATYLKTSGAIVTVEALPDTGYLFDHWEGFSGDSSANPLTLTLSGDLNLRAVFRADPLKTENSNQEHLPAEFRLEQNYPNPFNPSTTIGYILPHAAPVRLTVYDLLGREVANLVEGVQPAGHHQVVWDAGELKSGVYFYVLEAGEFRQIRKMILLR